MLDIIKSEQIWSTDIRFLNDQTEYHGSAELFREMAYTRMAGTFISSKRVSPVEFGNRCRSYLFQLMRELQDSESLAVNTFVVSFSEHSDDLSQWRAYARPAGVAIGFSGKSLRNIALSQGFRLVKCIYDDDVKNKMLRSLLESKIDLIGKMPRKVSERDEYMNNVLNLTLIEFQYMAAIFKHPAFRSEAEWRLVSDPLANEKSANELTFHSSGSTLIPHAIVRFMNVPTDIDVASAAPTRVIVGPSPYPKLNRASVASALRRFGFDETKVYTSVAPFRDL